MMPMLTARHFEITDPLRQYVEKKYARLDRFAAYIISAELILATDGGFGIAEGRLGLRRDVLTATAKEPDLYLAIRVVLEKLEKQLIRHDERIRTRKRQTRGTTA